MDRWVLCTSRSLTSSCGGCVYCTQTKRVRDTAIAFRPISVRYVILLAASNNCDDSNVRSRPENTIAEDPGLLEWPAERVELSYRRVELMCGAHERADCATRPLHSGQLMSGT
jgi:hypothetical protein